LIGNFSNEAQLLNYVNVIFFEAFLEFDKYYFLLNRRVTGILIIQNSFEHQSRWSLLENVNKQEN